MPSPVRISAGPKITRDAWEICEQDLDPSDGCSWAAPTGMKCPGSFEGCIKHVCMATYHNDLAEAGCIAINTPWNPDTEETPTMYGMPIRANSTEARTMTHAARNAVSGRRPTHRQARTQSKIERRYTRRPSVGASPHGNAYNNVLEAANHAYLTAYGDYEKGEYLVNQWHDGLQRKVYHTAWHEAAAGMPIMS